MNRDTQLLDFYIGKDIEEVSWYVGEKVLEFASKALQRKGSFTWVLSGGQTPQSIFEFIVNQHCNSKFWERTHIFWVDERCVSPDHSDSNFGTAHRLMLKYINFGGIHPIHADIPPQQAAENYETEIKDYFSLKPGQLPVFDLMLLGIGEDGHVASLFSKQQIKQSGQKLVTGDFIEKIGSHRISMTMPVINNAENRIVLACGIKKAPVFKSVKEHLPGNYPIMALDNKLNKPIWAIDQELATSAGIHSLVLDTHL